MTTDNQIEKKPSSKKLPIIIISVILAVALIGGCIATAIILNRPKGMFAEKKDAYVLTADYQLSGNDVRATKGAKNTVAIDRPVEFDLGGFTLDLGGLSLVISSEAEDATVTFRNGTVANGTLLVSVPNGDVVFDGNAVLEDTVNYEFRAASSTIRFSNSSIKGKGTILSDSNVEITNSGVGDLTLKGNGTVSAGEGAQLGTVNVDAEAGGAKIKVNSGAVVAAMNVSATADIQIDGTVSGEIKVNSGAAASDGTVSIKTAENSHVGSLVTEAKIDANLAGQLNSLTVSAVGENEKSGIVIAASANVGSVDMRAAAELEVKGNVSSMIVGETAAVKVTVSDTAVVGTVLISSPSAVISAEDGAQINNVVVEETAAATVQVSGVDFTTASKEDMTKNVEDLRAHNFVLKNETAPTCTEPGVLEYFCDHCNETQTTEIPALGHDFSVYAVEKEPQKLSAGKGVYTCSRCGETKTVSIPALIEADKSESLYQLLSYLMDNGTYSFSVDPDSKFVVTNADWNESVEINLANCALKVTDHDVEGYVDVALTITENKEVITGAFKVILTGQTAYYYSETSDTDDTMSGVLDMETALSFLCAQMLGVPGNTVLDAVEIMKQLPSMMAKGMDKLFELLAAVDFGKLILPAEGATEPVDLSSLILTESKDENGNTVLALDVETVMATIGRYADATPAELIDRVFGEGSTDALIALAYQIPDMKLTEVADAVIAAAETCDIGKDQLYAVVNKIVGMVTGEEIDLEALLAGDDFKDVTVALMTGMDPAEFSKFMEQLKAVLDTKIGVCFQTETMTTEQFLEMVQTYISGAQLTVTIAPDGSLLGYAISYAEIFSATRDFATGKLEFAVNTPVFTATLTAGTDETGKSTATLTVTVNGKEYSATAEIDTDAIRLVLDLAEEPDLSLIFDALFAARRAEPAVPVFIEEVTEPEDEIPFIEDKIPSLLDEVVSEVIAGEIAVQEEPIPVPGTDTEIRTPERVIYDLTLRSDVENKSIGFVVLKNSNTFVEATLAEDGNFILKLNDVEFAALEIDETGKVTVRYMSSEIAVFTPDPENPGRTLLTINVPDPATGEILTVTGEMTLSDTGLLLKLAAGKDSAEVEITFADTQVENAPAGSPDETVKLGLRVLGKEDTKTVIDVSMEETVTLIAGETKTVAMKYLFNTLDLGDGDKFTASFGYTVDLAAADITLPENPVDLSEYKGLNLDLNDGSSYIYVGGSRSYDYTTFHSGSRLPVAEDSEQVTVPAATLRYVSNETGTYYLLTFEEIEEPDMWSIYMGEPATRTVRTYTARIDAKDGLPSVLAFQAESYCGDWSRIDLVFSGEMEVKEVSTTGYFTYDKDGNLTVDTEKAAPEINEDSYVAERILDLYGYYNPKTKTSQPQNPHVYGYRKTADSGKCADDQLAYEEYCTACGKVMYISEGNGCTYVLSERTPLPHECSDTAVLDIFRCLGCGETVMGLDLDTPSYVFFSSSETIPAMSGYSFDFNGNYHADTPSMYHCALCGMNVYSYQWYTNTAEGCKLHNGIVIDYAGNASNPALSVVRETKVEGHYSESAPYTPDQSLIAQFYPGTLPFEVKSSVGEKNACLGCGKMTSLSCSFFDTEDKGDYDSYLNLSLYYEDGEVNYGSIHLYSHDLAKATAKFADEIPEGFVPVNVNWNENGSVGSKFTVEVTFRDEDGNTLEVNDSYKGGTMIYRSVEFYEYDTCTVTVTETTIDPDDPTAMPEVDTYTYKQHAFDWTSECLGDCCTEDGVMETVVCRVCGAVDDDNFGEEEINYYHSYDWKYNWTGKLSEFAKIYSEDDLTCMAEKIIVQNQSVCSVCGKAFNDVRWELTDDIVLDRDITLYADDGFTLNFAGHTIDLNGYTLVIFGYTGDVVLTDSLFDTSAGEVNEDAVVNGKDTGAIVIANNNPDAELDLGCIGFSEDVEYILSDDLALEDLLDAISAEPVKVAAVDGLLISPDVAEWKSSLTPIPSGTGSTVEGSFEGTQDGSLQFFEAGYENPFDALTAAGTGESETAEPSWIRFELYVKDDNA